MSQRKTLFISDLHLEESKPQTAQLFLDLLDERDALLDAIYILGDLFEAWIGDDDDTPFHRKIISSLKAATQSGLPIYFLHGNRDFLIGKRFLRETGCQFIAEEEKILLYHAPVLLMHGDTLCTQDSTYLKWRKKCRNPFLNRLLFLLWPLSFRRKLAHTMREKSRQHTQYAAKEIMDVTQEEVERIMQKHDVPFLIHGHTHKPGFHHFSPSKTRIVLGAWHDAGSVLVWNESGNKELVELKIKNG